MWFTMMPWCSSDCPSPSVYSTTAPKDGTFTTNTTLSQLHNKLTWLAVTEVWSASFGLVLHAQHTYAKSFNFLVTWGLPVTVFHHTCIFCVYGIALYWPTLQFYVYMYVSFVCQYVAPPGECYYNTLLCCDNQVRYCTLSVPHVYSKFGASSSSPRLPLCQIMFLFQPPLLS